MTIEQNFELINEWQVLHKSHEQYEHFALLIKLVAVVLVIALIIFPQQDSVSLLMLAILWLQEGIWKTYQARTADRIILIEEAISNIEQSETRAFQLYRQWSADRPGALSLIKEYLKNSIKPTVIYPYLPLMVFGLIT